jgi:hypothetical protein
MTVAAPRWLPLALLGLLATAIALGGGVSPGAASLLCLLTGAIGLVAASSRRLPALSPAAWGLALLGSGVALASLVWKRHPEASLDGAAAAICASLVWMLGAALVDGKARCRFVLGLAICGAVVALLALAQAGPGHPAAMPLGEPNHLAAWLLLPGSLALVALLHSEPTPRGGRESAFLWFGLVGIIGAGIAAEACRGASLAAALALVVLLLLYLFGPQRGILVGATSIVATALILLLAPAVAPHPPPLEVAGSTGGLQWVAHAASASTALDVSPLGAGIGAFASSFEVFGPPAILQAASITHGGPIQELVEPGLPFLAVFAVTLLVIFLGARGMLSRPRSPRCTWGAVMATLSLSAHSLIDFSLDVPAIALCGAALAGLAFAGIGAGGRERGTSDRVGSSATTRSIVAGLSIALLVLTGLQTAAPATW